MNPRVLLACLAAALSFSLLASPAEAARRRGPAPAIVTCDLHGCSDRPGAGMAAKGPSRRAQAHSNRGKGPSTRETSGAAPARPGRGYEVRQTGLGPIEVATGFADRAVAVANEVAAGHPGVKITCRSFSKSHVRGSFHFRARACDVCQHGWGRTCVPRAELTAIVVRHGLRDGCEFRDWGHFDDGPHLPRSRVIRNCGVAYADAVDGKRQIAKQGTTR